MRDVFHAAIGAGISRSGRRWASAARMRAATTSGVSGAGLAMLVKGLVQRLMNSRQQTTRTTAGRAFSTAKSSVPEETGIAPTGCLRKKAPFKANGVAPDMFEGSPHQISGLFRISDVAMKNGDDLAAGVKDRRAAEAGCAFALYEHIAAHLGGFWHAVGDIGHFDHGRLRKILAGWEAQNRQLRARDGGRVGQGPKVSVTSGGHPAGISGIRSMAASGAVVRDINSAFVAGSPSDNRSMRRQPSARWLTVIKRG